MTDPGPRILVIDDEQHQLDTVCRGLHLYGYRCQGVASVDEALDALASQNGDAFDLALTDLTMPGRSGLEFIERAQERYPSLPIVVVTGLAASVELATVRAKNLPLLHKPFGPDALDTTIRQALGLD